MWFGAFNLRLYRGPGPVRPCRAGVHALGIGVLEMMWTVGRTGRREVVGVAQRFRGMSQR